MNDETSSRPQRAGILAATLLAAACGGGSHVQAPGAQSGASLYQQAVAYSKCMRSHGDPAWPDPTSSGAYANNNGSLDRTSAAYKTAANACKKLEPTGGIPAAQVQQDFNKLLKYSACMRAHGVLKFPDPTMDHGVGIAVPGSIDPNSPQFKAADQACRSLMPGGS
ncbi:MAG: hypothetical protein JWN00_4241 [Actinomycetia bacterium]|jgi:hypothetical protein|nr:hypothetical protein [Actinomycetes bacterium]